MATAIQAIELMAVAIAYHDEPWPVTADQQIDTEGFTAKITIYRHREDADPLRDRDDVFD